MIESDKRSDNVLYWLWLEMVFGVASIRLHKLLEQFADCRELYYALCDPDCTLSLSDRERRNLRQANITRARELLQHCEKQHIGILTIDSDLYPDALRRIYNPPFLLFYRGNPEILHERLLLTAVGARRPSAYSLRVCDSICQDLARCGVVMVSGCAVGIDAAAHRAALAMRSPTIAVLGSGIDYDYPKENRMLKEQIAQNGLLLTEYFPGTQPYPGNFPVRNRILSGLSEAVLIVEASSKSGSLITANLACEQGKTVFCIPPADLFDSRYSGVVNFLRDGAYPAFSYLDILYAFYLEYPQRFDRDLIFPEVSYKDSQFFSEETEQPEHSSASAERQSAAAEPPAPVQQVPSAADTVQRQILELLQKEGCQSANSLCELLDMDFEEVSMQLTEMELSGWIISTGRDLFALPPKQRNS